MLMSHSDLPPAQPTRLPPVWLQSARTILALMLREMSTRYGRSPGGYLWALLEPLGATLIIGIAFSMMMRSPPLGTSFILFYASGFVPFGIYQNISATCANALKFSKALLQFPGVTWPDAILARFFLNALTNIMITVIILTAVVLVLGITLRPDYLPMLQAMLLLLLAGLSVGMLNCALTGLIPIWGTLWSIISRPMFLASGVIFIYPDLPPAVQNILWYNPLIHILDLFRSGIYPTYNPAHINITYVLSTCLITLFFGVVLLGRYHRFILSHR